MYIDSHAHFDLTLEDGSITEDRLLLDMKSAEVLQAVQVGIDAASSAWSYAFARRRASDGIIFTAGIHPSSKADSGELHRLEALLAEIKSAGDSGLLFGIGECGLDYYRKRQDRVSQEASFRFQIELANRYNLPVIVHSRDAMDDTLRILKEECRTFGIMHCFASGAEAARQVLDLGFYLSFAGNVTYKSATLLHEAARFVPADRLLLETDSPFLAPVPLRGKKNRPEHVIHTYRFVSELRGEPVSKLIDAVNENFLEICGHALKKI